MEDKQWVIPPGLHQIARKFVVHYNISENKPIIIFGETGVGKSLFMKIAEQLFLKQHPDVQEERVIRANCSHFGGQHSDANIARAELFGCNESLKANSTFFRKDGLIKKADKGLLLLDEVGELPREVQAMLLTYIETKDFEKVGGGIETSTARIVAATNNKKQLRDDFIYRFLSFEIPPIRKRREDVFFYIYNLCPDIINDLYLYEALCMHLYNWPGNVREIEEVSLLLLREKKLSEFSTCNDDATHPDLLKDSLFKNISFGDERDTGIKVDEFLKFEMAFFTFFHERLYETKLYPGKLFFDFIMSYMYPDYSPQKISVDISCKNLNDDLFTFFEGVELLTCSYFEYLFNAFCMFCDFFRVNIDSDNDILTDLNYKENINNPSRLRYIDKSGLTVRELFMVDPEDFNSVIEFEEFFTKEGKRNRLQSEHKIEQDIWSLKYDKLLMVYYIGILRLVKGNIKSASERMGIDERTLRNHLKKMKIDHKMFSESSVAGPPDPMVIGGVWNENAKYLDILEKAIQARYDS